MKKKTSPPPFFLGSCRHFSCFTSFLFITYTSQKAFVSPKIIVYLLLLLVVFMLSRFYCASFFFLSIYQLPFLRYLFAAKKKKKKNFP